MGPSAREGSSRFPSAVMTPRGWRFKMERWPCRRLNPMASLVASYRDILYRGAPTGLDFLFRTIVTCVVVFVIGYLVFCRFSRVFGVEV